MAQPGSEEGYLRFQIRALALAPVMGFDPGLVNEAIGILDAALGGSWLHEAETRQVRGPSLGSGHPLRHAVQVAGEIQIAEVLELCHYLKSVPDAIRSTVGLKANYAHAMLQLAFAHRFTLAGATDVQLEPDVSSGCGDIAFSFGGVPFVAECWVPGGEPHRGGSEEELQLFSSQIFAEFERFEELPGHPCASLAIQLLGPMTAARRKVILRAVRERLSTRALQPELIELDCARVFVAPVQPARSGEKADIYTNGLNVDGQPDLTTALGRAPAERVHSLTNPDFEGIHTSRMGVWTGATPSQADFTDGAKEELARIIRRLGRKMRQTKRDDRARRVLIVQTWAAGDPDYLGPQELNALRREALAYENSAGVLLVARRWNDDRRRHFFRIVASGAGPENPCGLVEEAESALSVPHLAQR